LEGDWVDRILREKLGDGAATLFLDDWWIEDITLKLTFPR
jgi:hypothetical protein